MKNFFEMWKIIEQGPVAAPTMPNAAPNAAPTMPNAAPTMPNAAPTMPNNRTVPNPAPNTNKPNQPNVTPNATQNKSAPAQQNSPELQKFVDELTRMLDDGTDLGNFQSQLKKYINNSGFFEAATSTGPEDKLGVTNSPIDVSLLIPTQSEVFLENSVDAGLENRFGNAPKIIAGTDPAAAGSVVVAKIGANYHIIDGHHRWSQFMCFNPKSKIQCKIINGMNSALQGLKVTHLAVAIEKKSVPSESGKASDKNLLQMSKEQVVEYVKNKIGNSQTNPKTDKTGNPLGQPEPILDMLRKNIPEALLPNARQASIDEIANYIGDNSQLVKVAAGKAQQANSRIIMPQTGGTSFDKELSTGSINVSPKESQRGTPSLNEWLVLSGIKKYGNY